MNPIRLPIFVRLRDCGEKVRYDSVAKMQAQFERIDVENAEYDAWDAAGVRLGLSVQASADWLRVESTEKFEPRQLAKTIAEFARLQGVDVDSIKLEAGDFQGAWEQLTSAVQAKRLLQKLVAEIYPTSLSNPERVHSLSALGASSLCSLRSLCLNPIKDGRQTHACARSDVGHFRRWN